MVEFNQKEYKTLTEIFPDAKLYSAPQLLSRSKNQFKMNSAGIFMPTAPGEPKLESLIKIGGPDAQTNPGEKIQFMGYSTFFCNISPEIHHLNVAHDPEERANVIICHVGRRDVIDSPAILNMLSIITPNLNNGSGSKSKPDLLAVYGTVQQSGHLFVEVDAVEIGYNLMSHKYKKSAGFN
jgi:hypothetical protein